MDINQILQKSKTFGMTEIPAGSANNAEAEKAILAILDASAGKYFRSKDLSTVLNEGGIKIAKIGNLLHAMKNQDKVTSPAKGVYTKFNGKSNKVA